MTRLYRRIKLTLRSAFRVGPKLDLYLTSGQVISLRLKYGTDAEVNLRPQASYKFTGSSTIAVTIAPDEIVAAVFR